MQADEFRVTSYFLTITNYFVIKLEIALLFCTSGMCSECEDIMGKPIHLLPEPQGMVEPFAEVTG